MKNRFLLPTTVLVLVSLFSFPALSNDKAVIPAGEAVPVKDPALPLPFGVGAYYFGQQEEYVVTGLRATVLGNPFPGLGAGAITEIENRVDQFNFKGDYWVFPWLNVHGIVGYGTGEATATLSPLVQPLLGAASFTVDYDTVIYGGGITLAAGHDRFFASITADYTWADVDMEDRANLTLNDPNGIETLIISPKIGIHGERGAVWVGAFYQYTQHTQSGTFLLPGPTPVNFEADVEDKTPWSPVIGGEFYFNEFWSLTAEYSFGDDRQQGLLGITRRF